MLAATIFTSTGVLVPIAFHGQHAISKQRINVGRVKSSVDDLTMERGTVSMRVAFVLRSAEVQPLFRDLCDLYSCCYSHSDNNRLQSSILSPQNNTA